MADETEQCKVVHRVHVKKGEKRGPECSTAPSRVQAQAALPEGILYLHASRFRLRHDATCSYDAFSIVSGLDVGTKLNFDMVTELPSKVTFVFESFGNQNGQHATQDSSATSCCLSP